MKRVAPLGGLGGTKRFHPLVCPAPECDKATKKGGAWCPMHHARLERHGSLEGRTPRSRFMEKVEVRQDTGCWVWTGFVNEDGYGHAYTAGTTLAVRNTSAHRVAYELFIGSIPQGMHIDHLCHTRDESCTSDHGCPHRRCVNPQHLEAVSPAENTRRGHQPTIVAYRTDTCARGHDLNNARVTQRANGSTFRQCRECVNIAAAQRRASRRDAA